MLGGICLGESKKKLVGIYAKVILSWRIFSRRKTECRSFWRKISLEEIVIEDYCPGGFCSRRKKF